MYTLIDNLSLLIDNLKIDSIISHTFYKDDHLRAILFGFDAGQELSEHMTNQTALIQIIEGEAEITLEGETKILGAGAWIHMTPHLKHSVLAKTPLMMLLLMMKSDDNE